MANLCGRLLLNIARRPATMAPVARYCKSKRKNPIDKLISVAQMGNPTTTRKWHSEQKFGAQVPGYVI